MSSAGDTEAGARADTAGTRLFGAVAEEVSIYEVGPRDGLQNEQHILTTEQKLELIGGLTGAGLTRIEVTSFVDRRWVPALADHHEVATRLERKDGVIYSALVPNMRGLDAAIQAGFDEVALFVAASDTHNRKNTNRTTSGALATYRKVAAEARGRGMRVRGYLSTVYGCPYEGSVEPDEVLRIAHALFEMGVYELSLGDTIGVGTPRQVAYVLERLVGSGLPLDQLAVHFHDTRGTALANVTIALQLGVRTIDCAIGGTGGCPYAPGASGNVATEDVVYMLRGMGVATGVDLDALVRVSAGLGGRLGRELPSKYLKAHLGHCARHGIVI